VNGDLARDPLPTTGRADAIDHRQNAHTSPGGVHCGG